MLQQFRLPPWDLPLVPGLPEWEQSEPFAGAPLTQTIYGLILMNAILASSVAPVAKMAAGIFGGAGIGFSALAQGRAGASAADALGETGKGFVNYLMVIGIVETVALFVMVFLMSTLR